MERGAESAEVGRQPVAERRHPRAEAGVLVVPAEALTELPAQREQGADRAGLLSAGRSSRPPDQGGEVVAPPGVGSAQTSSTSKSGVSSWIRQGREVWALFGSLADRHIHTVAYGTWR